MSSGRSQQPAIDPRRARRHLRLGAVPTARKRNALRPDTDSTAPKRKLLRLGMVATMPKRKTLRLGMVSTSPKRKPLRLGTVSTSTDRNELRFGTVSTAHKRNVLRSSVGGTDDEPSTSTQLLPRISVHRSGCVPHAPGNHQTEPRGRSSSRMACPSKAEPGRIGPGSPVGSKPARR
jgi:hypothetical protein